MNTAKRVTHVDIQRESGAKEGESTDKVVSIFQTMTRTRISIDPRISSPKRTAPQMSHCQATAVDIGLLRRDAELRRIRGSIARYLVERNTGCWLTDSTEYGLKNVPFVNHDSRPAGVLNARNALGALRRSESSQTRPAGSIPSPRTRRPRPQSPSRAPTSIPALASAIPLDTTRTALQPRKH